MLTARIFAHLSQLGSWVELTDPAFIPALLFLHRAGNILGTAGLSGTVPQ